MGRSDDDPAELPLQMPPDWAEAEPPPELEQRVVAALDQRGLLRRRRSSGWRFLRAAMVSAAGLAFLSLGVLIGRLSAPSPGPDMLPGSGAGGLYVVLLYETPGYDRSAPARQLFGEYSRWVGQASEAGLFAGGEDFATGDGVLVGPEGVKPSVVLPGGAPLSGMFFLRTGDEEAALALVRDLPHVRHGGHAVMQRTISTLTPPDA